MSASPLTFVWDGDVMMPVASCRRAANERYVVGERYRLEEIEETSTKSRGHYFASLRETFRNLPDSLAGEFGTVHHLRKRALIETGHYDERRFAASSPEEARKLLAFLKPTDEFAVFSVAQHIVIERKAKSQSGRAMGKPTFEQSKRDVLDWCAGLLGVDRADVPQQEAA